MGRGSIASYPIGRLNNMAWLDRVETNIKVVWAHWSSKVLSILVLFPEAYNGLSDLGWWSAMPSNVAHIMSFLATIGFLAKFYKQNL